MEYADIQYQHSSWTALITLNRPQQMNALTRRLEAELRHAIDRADADPGVRAIVLTGAGRAFCAGMDMGELAQLPPEDIRDPARMRPFDMSRRPDYQTRYSYFPACSKPIIAAVNGAAAGLGLVMALYSDFRYASPHAVFTTAFARRGLVAEHGTAWILPRVVGHACAIDMLMSSRKVAADEALRLGLVLRVVEGDALLEETLAFAETLATEVSPRSLRVMKRQLWEAPFQDLAGAVRLANDEMVDSLRSADFQEGVAHFVQKRRAAFTGQ
ncbi:enoyl-CoA hydratase [Achromobacter insolitus]|uniref:enoyl-CoA hydratase n=1 Tax=Achromobacter insolitus TaxID=217204 RepID=UPI00265872E0|nr:enoyl-CoA hydratase [Achromobacter insolitus]WKK18661.1 enoyl-CoA hydratase [Achromobacter insolitus]